MAYLDLSVDLPRAAIAAPVRGPVDEVRAAASQVTPLERRVVRLAFADARSSLETPGWIATMMRRLFSVKSVNRLADPRLEALRRFVVMYRMCGEALPVEEVDRLLGAGFAREALAEIRRLVRTSGRAVSRPPGRRNIVMTILKQPGSGNDPSPTRRIDPVRIAIGAACIGTGAAAVGAFYARLCNEVGDPLPAAIVTLLAMTISLAVLGPKADRP